jgi:hypothetical protein
MGSSRGRHKVLARPAPTLRREPGPGSAASAWMVCFVQTQGVYSLRDRHFRRHASTQLVPDAGRYTWTDRNIKGVGFFPR